MKTEDQLSWADMPEALRASIELDKATEILRSLATDDDDAWEEDSLVDDAPIEFIKGETTMWF